METGNSERKMVSSEEISRIIGKDVRTVQIMAKQGILTCEKVGRKNSYDLYVVIQEYCEHLTKTANRKISSMEDEKLAEDIRIKRAKADMAELELQELKGTLHAAEDVEEMTTDLILVIRSSFLALPGKVSAELAEMGDASEVSERLRNEIFDILKDLSNYEYNSDEYRKRVRERRGWLRDGQEEECAGNG